MRVLFITAMVLSLAATAFAVPIRTAEYGTIPQHGPNPGRDQFHLSYYNMCSGYVLYWVGYCFGFFEDAPEAAMYGTCFDLADCPGDCRHLEDVWWACNGLHYWGWADIEIYCADEDCCPVGPPIAGIYDYGPDLSDPWQHFDFGGLSLCDCEESASGKFIVMITEYCPHELWGCAFLPFSDRNHANIDDGCETEWRCTGHSYVYRTFLDYCELYGMPGPVWTSGPDFGCPNPPTVPPGCHYPNGFYAEWLIDCYLSCEGPTATDKTSWSEIKGLYR